MNLTEYFFSLGNIDKSYNKYAAYSLAFNNPYRLVSSYDAFKYDKFDIHLRQFIAEEGKCIAMPNMLNGEVIGIMFRSVAKKQFRYYTECKHIPYGAGVNNKPYYKPWVIVESALDSDFIRNFYPFVIATNGVSVSNNTMDFIKGTSSTVYCAFDSDKAGIDGFHTLCKKHSGKECFHIKRLAMPMNLDGGYLKDFGEVLDLLYSHKLEDYNYYVMAIKESLMLL